MNFNDVVLLHNIYNVPRFMITDIDFTVTYLKKHGIVKRITEKTWCSVAYMVLTYSKYKRFNFDESVIWEWNSLILNEKLSKSYKSEIRKKSKEYMLNFNDTFYFNN